MLYLVYEELIAVLVIMYEYSCYHSGTDQANSLQCSSTMLGIAQAATLFQ